MLLATLVILSGCQAGYLMKSAYGQAEILRRRIPLEDALTDPRVADEHKRKLALARDAKEFAEKHLGLAHTKNYSSYVDLDRPYVTWVVSAARRDKLEAHLWKYPIVGSMPYKGFFDLESANAEAAALKASGLDVFVRGVSAYSTLGWFNDPLLSSMLRYKDFDLVDTIIHETLHATVFIKSEADFNERLATFFGRIGTEAYYRHKEGDDGPTLAAFQADLADEKLFNEFMSEEIKSLETWYAERVSQSIDESERLSRLEGIKKRFTTVLRPKFRSKDAYKNFEQSEINNARLLTYRLYFGNLDEFDKVFRRLGGDFGKMLEFSRSLEKASDPKARLAQEAGLL